MNKTRPGHSGAQRSAASRAPVRRPETDDVETFLRSIKPFDVLDTPSLRALVACVERRTFDKDDQLIAAGDPGDALYVLLKGRVQVAVVDADGPRRVASLYGGDMVGEMALLTGEPRVADVFADVPTECIVISRDAFYDVVDRDPSVAHFLTELLGKRMLDGGHISHVGNYQVFEEIGRGGMGIVFAGWHPQLRRSVAIKMLEHAHVFDERFASSFQAESSIVAALDHPNIVRVFDHEAAYGTQFIVMEMVDGATLADRIRVTGPMDEATVRRIIVQLAGALEHAHSRGITHRDVKPENVMLPMDGALKLMDFGIAGPVHETHDEAIGTPAYMAPEQTVAGELDARVDIYPLGIMAFEMLTGERPFHADDTREVLTQKAQEPPPDVRLWRREISDAMAEFVQRAAAPHPEDRFADCAAIRAHFGADEPLVRPGLRNRTITVLYDAEEGSLVGDATDQLVATLAGRGTLVSISDHDLG